MTEPFYDVILFGATGFTGRLVAGYLARKQDEQFAWAIAGRTIEKLQRVKSELGLNESIGTVVADTADYASLVAMTQQAQVVLTTVGPYTKYGEPLVRACIETGTDYVDITGEPDFVNQMIASYDAAAQTKGVRIVNCCGFDSIPHDLGVYHLVQHLSDNDAVQAEGLVTFNGSLSGGTWQTAIMSFANVRNRVPIPSAARAVVGEGRVVRSRKPRVHYAPAVKAWVAPMPTIDPQIVLRSARALPSYGREFRYSHYVNVGSLPRLVGLAGLVGGAALLAQVRPTRNWLLSLRQPGDGPTPEQIAQGSYRVTFVATTSDGRMVAEARGGDPGYGETAKMVGESALCLTLDRAQLPARTGVLTPAVAMGDRLLARLRKAGLVFEIIEEARLPE